MIPPTIQYMRQLLSGYKQDVIIRKEIMEFVWLIWDFGSIVALLN